MIARCRGGSHCTDPGAASDELPGHLHVVAERCDVQRGVAFVDLGEAFGHEALIASGQAHRGQRGRGVEERHRSSSVTHSDRGHQPRQVAHARQDARSERPDDRDARGERSLWFGYGDDHAAQ
jgi:hypothetical protein